MDTFSFVRPKLAHDVMEVIKERGRMTRAELNSHFKAVNNQKRCDALTLIVKSLVAYEHVNRHFNLETNILTLWPQGVTIDLQPMVSKVSCNEVEDYLTQYLTNTARNRMRHESVVEGAVTHGTHLEESSEEKDDEDSDTPANTDPPSNDEDDTLTIPSATSSAMPVRRDSLTVSRDLRIAELDKKDPNYWHKLGRIPELTLDQFILMYADNKAFTKKDVEDCVGPARASYVGTRLAHAVKFNKIVQYVGAAGDEMWYCLPGRVPVGATTVGGSVLPTGSTQLVKGVGKLAVLMPQAQQPTAASQQREQHSTFVPKFGEPVASLSKHGLSLQREDGSIILFTDKEKRELVDFVTNFL